MSRLRIYIKPFDVNGNYDDYIEVTDEVDASSLSTLKRAIDSTEYDIGVIKINNFSIKLLNETGKFSDVDSLRSIFSYKRSDSLIRITWSPNDFEQRCGSLNAGSGILTGESGVVIFNGILNDEATVQNIGDQKISFKCFGLEYLLTRMIVPFDSISIGDTIEELLLISLNQAPFNALINVEAGNISVGNNVTIDNKEELENEIVYDSLDNILLASNSVLYIEDSTLYISAREESAENKFTFYGEASNNGTENIEKISNYRNGLHRVFNYWTWEDTAYVEFDDSSVGLFGARKKSLSLSLVEDSGSIATILEGLRDEFSNRKQELTILCKLDESLLGLKILDKVNIDYPTIVYSSDGEDIPVYGVSKFGAFKYPLDEYAFTISPLDEFKIIAIDYNLKSERISFKLREI